MHVHTTCSHTEKHTWVPSLEVVTSPWAFHFVRICLWQKLTRVCLVLSPFGQEPQPHLELPVEHHGRWAVPFPGPRLVSADRGVEWELRLLELQATTVADQGCALASAGPERPPG
jgi:hypothetical protein